MVKFTGKNVIRFIIASVILVTGALFVFNKPTNAETISYIKVSSMTPEQQVASYAYAKGLANCHVYTTFRGELNLTQLLSDGTTAKAVVGHIAERYADKIDIDVSRDDGEMQCSGIFKAGIKLWTGKSIENLDQATKEDILKNFGFSSESVNEYYCYANFNGEPNTHYPGLYKYTDKAGVPYSAYPFAKLPANGIADDQINPTYISGIDSFEGYDGALTWAGTLLAKDSNGKEVIAVDKYNDLCKGLANMVGVMDNGYSQKISTPTTIWKLGGSYTLYDFLYKNVYEQDSINLDDIGKYYVYNYYYLSTNETYGCQGTNLGKKDEFIKSIEGNNTVTIPPSGNIIWIDSVNYNYDEITRLVAEDGTVATYSFYEKNKALTDSSGKIKLAEIAGSELTCPEIAKKLSAAATKISTTIKDSLDGKPYGDVLGLLLADNENITELENDHLGSSQSENQTTCAIDGIGWLICPVTKAMSKLVDAAYSLVSGMLTTPALNTDTSGSETAGASDNSMYAMWKIMRTFANIAFVIAFLMITFSQMTSMGINNYGIKKMLPKLIIAAILVNISYFMCAIAIDLSNIAGKGIYDLLDGINTSAVATTEKPTALILAGAADFAIGGIGASVAVAATGGAWAALSLLVPGLIAAVMAIVTVFLVLTLRQALIILLVVVSPLALVAYILPNTESWFKKWKDLFITMLMMFPIISAVFAISRLASSIVISGSNKNGMIALMGMFIQFIPLAITPLVLKSAGGVLNKFAGMVNNPNRGPFDAMKKGAVNLRKRAGNRANAEAMNLNENSTNKQWLKNGNGIRRSVLRYNARRDFLDKSMQSDVNRTTMEDTVSAASADGINGKASSSLNARMQKQMSPNAYSRSMANAKSALLKMRKEEIEERMQNMASNISSPGAELDELEAQLRLAIQAGDEVSARAAQGLLLKTAPGRDKIHKTYTDQSIVTAFGQKTSLLNNLKNDINSAGIKASDASLAKFAYDNSGVNTDGTNFARNLSDIDVDASTYEGLSMHEMSSQTKGNIRSMIDNGVITPEIAYKITDVKNGYNVAADKLPIFNEVAKNYVPPVQNNPNNP